ncbi:hypothetical protein [Petrachloros mirabilis]
MKMIRTIVYPKAPEDKDYDGIPEKLVKYIPAETVAFFVAVYPLFADKPDQDVVLKPYQVGVLILGIVGTLLYFYARSDKTKPPRLYFYLFVIVAFLGWAIGSSTVGEDLFKLPTVFKSAAIPTVVFIIPILDEALTSLLNPVTPKESTVSKV